MIKALIFDLDNTVYPVPQYGERMFGSLFQLIEQDGGYSGNMSDIKYDLMRKPFQLAAEKYRFSKKLVQKGTGLLKGLTYDGPIEPFSDYQEMRKISVDRYLVTAGFKKFQWSKIRALGIEKDFKQVYIVDISLQTKKDVFEKILRENAYMPSEALVVGDDPEGEIRAGRELGMITVLYDRSGRIDDAEANYKIPDLGKLAEILNLNDGV